MRLDVDHADVGVAAGARRPEAGMSDNYALVPVKDYVFHDIRLKVRCRNCGRERIVEGGLLPRSFPPEMRLSQWQVNQFAKRLVCGSCGARWPKGELGVWQ
jgi:hypothetical protein